MEECENEISEESEGDTTEEGGNARQTALPCHNTLKWTDYAFFLALIMYY